MLIIGESLNATRKEVREAVINKDAEKIQALAKEQVTAGADMLDVNAGIPGQNETENLQWMVKTVQEVVDIPLVLDSSDVDALIAAIEIHKGKPMINSISAEKDKLGKLLTFVTETDCSVIVLCMDDQGISNTVTKRLDAARVAVNHLLEKGKNKNDIYVDPLVMSIAADQKAAQTTYKVIEELKCLEEFDGVHIIGAVSNVSFGVPTRKIINKVFLSQAMLKGLDSCIVNVRDKSLMSTIYAGMSMLEEKGLSRYLKAYRKGLLEN